MTGHLPIGCAYVVEGDEVVEDPKRWATTINCEVCIAVITTRSITEEDREVRTVWHEAVHERLRLRRALYACGYEKSDETERSFGSGLLSDYVEEFVGPQGTVLVDWHGPSE